MKIPASRRPAAPQRGSSLIEVLVAMAILSIMMAGILQLFSLALLASAGAAARTELTFRCQQVVENIRFNVCLQRRGLSTAPITGITNPLVPGTYDLPYKSGTALWTSDYPYWGPTGANVITESGGPYKLQFSIAQSSASVNAMWVITVSAIPTDDPTAARRFFGLGLKNYKRVDYVASFTP